ncbi:MAG: hypothetical protein SCALA702_13140 [Melioribacteraceae bacterium]|nr:MAG: hypothetical protein SCALA702_13140 [Melioribacteraceae bacterium]
MENSTEFNQNPIDPKPEDKTPEEVTIFKKPPRKILLGVCSKIADRVSFNVTVVRVLFILLTIVGGWGIAAYILLAFFLPDNKSDLLNREERRYNFYLITGIAAISASVYFILEPTGLFDFMSFLGFRATLFVPAVIILALLFAYVEYGNIIEQLPEKITRSVKGRRIKGVCGGLAVYFDISPIIIRLFTLFFIFLTGGLGLLFYFYLAFTTREEEVVVNED